jgi:septal ring factor EnvC (AmiA/AmiB activator)
MATQSPTRKKTATAKKKSVKKKVAPASTKRVDENTDNRVLPGLMQSLQSVFDKIHKDNQVRDDNQEKLIEEFTQRLSHAFEQTHTEAREREQLLQEKLDAIEREQRYKIQRIKLFSLPGTLIAVAALIYLFYVVHVMERSMTSMSADMHQIQANIADIGSDTAQMSQGVVVMNQQMARINGNMEHINTNVQGMNGNMHHLNRNVGVMTNDVGAMSHTVSPVMNNMRKFMPMF